MSQISNSEKPNSRHLHIVNTSSSFWEDVIILCCLILKHTKLCRAPTTVDSSPLTALDACFIQPTNSLYTNRQDTNDFYTLFDISICNHFHWYVMKIENIKAEKIKITTSGDWRKNKIETNSQFSIQIKMKEQETEPKNLGKYTLRCYVSCLIHRTFFVRRQKIP